LEWLAGAVNSAAFGRGSTQPATRLTTMDALLVIGRILLVLVFLGSGVNHLISPAGFAAYSKFRGRPITNAVVIATGVWILLGGLMVALGILGDLGALMLIVFCLGTAVVVHHFWTDTEEQTKTAEITQFMKNLGLTGGLLLAFVLFRREEIGWTLTGPMF
jgi:putative oxidoreductase